MSDQNVQNTPNDDDQETDGFFDLAYVPPRVAGQSLRDWWHTILRNFGQYQCFAVILALPADEEAIRYLTDFGGELDIVSGRSSLVIALTKTGFRRFNSDDSLHSISIDEHLSNGHSVQIAREFDISLNKFPCIVLFKDIRSPEHLVVSLKDMKTVEIGNVMRAIFSTIDSAEELGEDPLKSLLAYREKEKFEKIKRAIANELYSLPGKTLELVIGAWIKTIIH